MNWITDTRKLYTIKPLPGNPRVLKKKEHERLKKSLRESGHHSVLVLDHEGYCLSGNQRLAIMESEGYEDVNVVYPEKPLTEEQRQRIIVMSNVSAGEFDFDILANSYMESIVQESGLIDKLPDAFEVDAADSILSTKEVEFKCEKCGHTQIVTLVD